RRLVGLWCFAWGTLHLISYSTLELGLSNLGLLGSELVNRPYLTLGILTWLILLALAATSTLWAMRKLGAKWQMLHNFVYLAAILAPIHYLWSVKTFSPQPFIYALLAVALLGLRYKKFRAWWR
ncbi:ferric reductase-like transmembrane domain-containing protein, partial [Serratia marcescens]|nr:ferric reductase-like transmembrane domain-containing protein [Serratia marcescens]